MIPYYTKFFRVRDRAYRIYHNGWARAALFFFAMQLRAAFYTVLFFLIDAISVNSPNYSHVYDSELISFSYRFVEMIGYGAMLPLFIIGIGVTIVVVVMTGGNLANKYKDEL